MTTLKTLETGLLSLALVTGFLSAALAVTLPLDLAFSGPRFVALLIATVMLTGIARVIRSVEVR